MLNGKETYSRAPSTTADTRPLLLHSDHLTHLHGGTRHPQQARHSPAYTPALPRHKERANSASVRRTQAALERRELLATATSLSSDRRRSAFAPRRPPVSNAIKTNSKPPAPSPMVALEPPLPCTLGILLVAVFRTCE